MPKQREDWSREVPGDPRKRIAVEPVYCAHQNNKTGEQCRNRPIKGGVVCHKHGGAAPQVRAKARERLLLAAEPAARKLIELMLDPNSPPLIQLNAARDLLDRAGLAGPQILALLANEGQDGMDRPWQRVFTSIVRKAEKRHGYDDDSDNYETTDYGASLSGNFAREGDVIEGEVVELPPACEGCGRPFPAELPPELDVYPTHCRDCRTAPPPAQVSVGPPPPAEHSDQDKTLEELTAEVAAANRRTGTLPPRQRTRRNRYNPNAPSEFGIDPRY